MTDGNMYTCTWFPCNQIGGIDRPKPTKNLINQKLIFYLSFLYYFLHLYQRLFVQNFGYLQNQLSEQWYCAKKCFCKAKQKTE